MTLRGDAVKSETYFEPEPDSHCYADGLGRQIAAMKNGLFLDDLLKNNHQTDFCIGVAGYPEKHMEAPSLEKDITRLESKIAAGAKYVVTQMFFNNQKFFEFEKRCRKNGITVPIIPGLKPIATKRQLTVLPHRFHVDLPDDFTADVEKCRDNKQVYQVGIEWCIEQSRELIAAGVPVLHYYSMGKSRNFKKTDSEVF